jgi:hypothetical protein
MTQPITDPVEALIAEALSRSGAEFIHNDASGLDFYLPKHHIYIECKQFHSERIVEQTRRVKNVIVIQGMLAAQVFAELIRVRP